MAARAIWKGVLKIGTNKVPVKLYSAVQDRSVHFHILDTSTKQPIKQRMVDPQNDQEVPNEKIQRGLELEPGTFVVIEEDELTKLEPKKSREIDIRRFVRQLGSTINGTSARIILGRTAKRASTLHSQRHWNVNTAKVLRAGSCATNNISAH